MSEESGAVITRPEDHNGVLSVLERSLPPAVLLVGPPGVGKTAVVRWLVLHHGLSPLDVVISTAVARMPAVTAIQKFLLVPALSGRRLVSLDLQGSAEGVQNALLKIVEEPPPQACIILRTSDALLPTLESRCIRFDLGALSSATVLSVLLSEGFVDDVAVPAAAASGGSLERARSIAATYEVRNRVATCVAILTTGPDDIVLDAVPQDMKDPGSVCSVLADVAAEYAVGRVHPMMEDMPVLAPPRRVAAVLADVLIVGRPSRALVRHALWRARAAR